MNDYDIIGNSNVDPTKTLNAQVKDIAYTFIRKHIIKEFWIMDGFVYNSDPGGDSIRVAQLKNWNEIDASGKIERAVNAKLI